MLVSNDRKLMGDHMKDRSRNVLSQVTTTLMCTAAVVLVWTWFTAYHQVKFLVHLGSDAAQSAALSPSSWGKLTQDRSK
jgi:hypothetical protein